MGLLDKLTSPVLDRVLGSNTVDPKTGQVTGESRINGPANELVEKLLGVGIDGRGPFEGADEFAQKALAEAKNPNAAVDDIIGKHLKLASAGGFVTGLGGFVTMVVAIPANVVEFYVLATRMVASIAKVRGYDLSQDETRSAVLLALVGGSDANEVMKAAGVVPTGRLAGLAAGRLPKSALMMINKGVVNKMAANLTEKGVAKFVGKGLPVVGGVVGAGLDYYLLKKIAANAKTQFPARPASA
ncbi:EcsC family protein [Arsenicicoccus piscis]|uniref:EcsC family protein n=1 Tax=Arsenicicoccus piscis TaxID=673954 RepID=A0ABQ6HKD0_9MICO|nr:EcsC family protein [Arsenicicoccus piscis]GMA18926.1 hypothetical protein GCM10025862_09470 [Arsenicicoccus piscis]